MSPPAPEGAAPDPYSVQRLGAWLAREVDHPTIVRGLIVASPPIVAFFLAGEPVFLNLGLLAMALFIPTRKLMLGPAGVAGEFLAILLSFGVLFLAFPVKGLFVTLTALAAFLAVAVTRYGARLRTLGNWVFIPALYLACELREEAAPGTALAHAKTLLLLAPVAFLLVLAVQLYDRRGRPTAEAPLFGPPQEGWGLPAAATAIAVFAAAGLVEALDLQQGQWLIWSAASVVVGDLATSSKKLRLRAMGVVVGAPLGLAVGLLLPQSRIGYTLAALGALLTLIAFSRYVVGFGLRCFLIAVAAALAGVGSGIAEERVENVLMGGAFGIAALVLLEFASRLRGRGPGARSNQIEPS